MPLLVDSAAGFGSIDEDGRPLGRQGAAELFSFHATKPLAVGEGGLLTTRDPTIAARITELSNFGFDKNRVVGGEPGINAKLDEWHSATALAALDRLDDVLAARSGHLAAMRESLPDLPADSGLYPLAERSDLFRVFDVTAANQSHWI